ncbi:ATP-binding protein [Streptomyces sp. NPDC001928]|uniref:ATP-binding protein n=1 Tax=Streptomyces sp. NPDC001928 TaxID=3154404 RepID=UPI00331F420B
MPTRTTTHLAERIGACADKGAEIHLWRLPHRPESAGAARRVAHAALQHWGVKVEAIERVLLVVSELVTNAVEHAVPPIALRLEQPVGDKVHVEVTDGGPSRTKGAWIASCDKDEHGRGGTIIDFLSTAHGSHSGACGAMYWADLAVAADRGVQSCPR